ncbi:Ldh family oxidoreductase [Pikeienuella sp. HZG-20]|uniref:Ldh family oxidoreductase n=1 Tax=Paludibacillus litoralis TaxID=3133267 RepID=UPI0030EB203A
MSQTRLTLDEVTTLALAALRAAGADDANAAALARTMWRAERDGAKSHGLFRTPGYALAISSGKANGRARPTITARDGAVIRMDGDRGFACRAHETGLPALADAAREFGVAALAIRRCFHFAALWLEVETLTDQGLAAMAVCSSPPYVHAAGGTRRVFGTNPMAFGWPRVGKPPMIFDQASSTTARGELSIAARDGHQAPPGAGIGPDGAPTTDPAAILAGAQSPFGGYKGASIALMVDLLAGPLIGELTSLETGAADNGVGPAIGGQLILAFAPERFGGADAAAHGERLFEALLEEPGVRLPGARRAETRARTPAEGVLIPTTLYDEIRNLA